jgi:glycosyltransferase involved in cell wall biosynthesis/LmbE family N-acetylglucosaminyl deacetylase
VVSLAEGAKASTTWESGVQVRRIHPGELHWYVSKMPGLGRLLAGAVREIERGWSVYRAVRRIAREAPVDMIEATETGAWALAVWFRSVPLVIRLHGEEFTFHMYAPDAQMTWGLRLTRFVQRLALRRARWLISPSRAHAREILGELGPHCPPIRIVPNCMDAAALPESDSSREAALILYVGRLERRKGVPVLLSAMSEVVREFPQARLALLGAHHPTLPVDEIETLVVHYDLQPHVCLAGHVAIDQLSRWYQRATLCVLPSYYETFGIAALEPMALGVPVVVSDRGGLPEVVEANVSGLVTPAGDAHALAVAIKRLLRDPEERRRLGEAGRRRAASQFTLEHALHHTLACYMAAREARTIQMESVDSAPGPHLYFSPHLDDVVLSCGGLVAQQAQHGEKPTVITVFTDRLQPHALSAFARHLHAKWRLADEAVSEARCEEDRRALRVLGAEWKHWDFAGAPYRQRADGRHLYCSYNAIRGALPRVDEFLLEQLYAAIRDLLAQMPNETRLYFPLGLARHVDHQILSRLGWRLWREGRPVFFYEEWPYVSHYQLAPAPDRLGWEPQTFEVPLHLKQQAALCYTSQIGGLGGTSATLAQRLAQSSTEKRRKRNHVVERLWAPCNDGTRPEAGPRPLPLIEAQPHIGLRHLSDLVAGFRWHDLDEIMPRGQGRCLDIGCGTGRHRNTIEQRGFSWFGLDRHLLAQAADSLSHGDSRHLPFPDGAFEGAVLWQTLEYVPDVASALAEVSRVLAPGGVICGSVSFLEPVHGRTYLGLSHVALHELLSRAGFDDIEVRPGLNGFSLLAWTWFRRWAGPAWGTVGLVLMAAWLIPLAFGRVLLSWIGYRLGLGNAHGMAWLTQRAPLEFAGHLLFVARKAEG